MAVPMVNFHSARVKGPDLFLDDKKAWATITIKPGIELVTAKLKKDGMGGPMTAQAYRFDISKFTVQQAKQWLKKHKVKAILFEPAKPKKEVKEMAGEIVSELCATPGMKKRSKGKGRGLARGMGKGPIGIPFGEEIKETTTVANIAAKVTEKCWGSLFPKKKKRSRVSEQKGAVVAASNSGVYAMKGSYEDLRSKIRKALEDSQLYGKYPEILSTFPKKVFVSNDKDEYFMIDYTIQGDEVKLGVATPIEKQVKFVIKEMVERCKLSLLNPLAEAVWKEQLSEERKGRASNPDRQALISGIAIGALKGIFEGGAGSGNWGHKGRPGHRGGSLGGGGKGSMTTGKGWGELPKARAMTGQEKKFWEKFRKERAAGGGGISAHVVKPGVHASTFYDKSGGLKTSVYRALTDSQKTSVLRHGVQKYKEAYVPKAKQTGMSAAALGTNKKVGALEGMRRAALSNAKSAKSGSKEERAAMHVAISLQQRVSQMASQLKASGEKAVGSAKGAGVQVTGAALTAAKTAERQPGARG